MKIAVLVKQVPDPNAVRLDARAGGIQAGAAQVANEYDLNAIEAAVQLAERQGDTEVVVASLGQAKETLNRCLAMGADRAVAIELPAPDIDTLGTATILAAWLRSESCDLILTGQESSDSGTGNVGPQVAALLDLPAVSNVVGLELANGTGSVQVRREVEDGRQVLEVQPPAVLCTLSGLNEPRYPSLKGIMAARRKPTETRSLSDLGLDAGALAPLVSWGPLFVEEEESEGTILRDVEPAETVERLIAFLRERKLV